MIEPMVKYGVTSLECKPDAEKRYNDWLHARLNKTVWQGGCNSYYKLGALTTALLVAQSVSG